MDEWESIKLSKISQIQRQMSHFPSYVEPRFRERERERGEDFLREENSRGGKGSRV